MDPGESRRDRLGMFDGVAHRQITTPRVAHHHPATDTDNLTDPFKISDRPLHGVRAAARASDAAWFGVPGAVGGRGDLVSFQILHATRSAGQDDQVGPLPGHAHVQRDALNLNQTRLHVRGR